MEFEFGQEVEVSDGICFDRGRYFVGNAANGQYICSGGASGERPTKGAVNYAVTLWNHARAVPQKPQKMVTVRGKEYSEETLQKMIKAYVCSA